MKKLTLLCAGLVLQTSMHGQSPEVLAVRNYRASHEKEIFNEFISFLTIPNVAADSANLRKSAAFIAGMMRQRGIGQVQLLTLPTNPRVPPCVYGEVIVPGATQTLIFYAHYDGQPVNPLQWAKGLSPFEPKLTSDAIDKGGKFIDISPDTKSFNPEWRIYARGASDDKAGVAAILNAYDAIIKTGRKPTYNLKFFFEGEEEAGSPHLNQFLERYRSLLKSDLWIICDGPVHQSGKKQVVFGVRGDAHLDLTVYASKRPLHSGHYGNWAPNPAMMLVELLASMKDDKGNVTISGFYDDVTPLSEAEQRAIREVPPVKE
jgi:acetylornithine deacetylase/succinyl-diaminopimelate desuccinylase-like protein